ncbi:MAG: helix-turn-helix transcriptional regulator [Oscillibacter sp.]|nr:helix-turn-helix transcriptional regulator [Oscillibacter sp.]
MTYGTRIKQAREECHLTQEQLAEELDISRQAVSKWEADLSKPTREKLDRLSEILDIPPETWAEIEEEMAAANAPPDASRLWKLATAALSAVCLVLAVCLTVSLRPKEELPPEETLPLEETRQPAAPSAEKEPTPVLPDAFPLFATHNYSFGDQRLGRYDPAEIPFLDDWEQVMDSELWCGWFPDGTRLSLVPVSARWNPEKYTNIYLLYAPPVETTDGALEYHILYRIGEDYVGTDRGAPDAGPFTNVLGYDGLRITISAAEDLYRGSHYIIQGPDGTPRMMTSTGSAAWEADVDDDGALEIVTYDEQSNKWCITDTRAGEEGAFDYALYGVHLNLLNFPSEYVFACDPDRGGFLITNKANTIISRCVLRDKALVCIPATDFSVRDYPDVADTRITFVTDREQSQTLSDGLDPDVILPYNPDVRITHRQQAYLALQELYGLTGLKLDSCYCAASEFGVYFSALPDGFNERGFFSACLGEDCGGSGIPSFHIWWKELGHDWSPLSFYASVRPEGGEFSEKIASYYDRMKVFNTGEIEKNYCLEPEPESEQRGYIGDGQFYLADGSLYEATYLMRDGDPVLISLYGPYPDGFAHH